MSTLDKLNDKSTEKNFNKRVFSVSQHLRAYVNHRLYIAESTGIIPKNMYNSADLIDEAIAKFYEKGYNIDDDSLAIKLKLFRIVDAELDNLFVKEAFHKDTLSTNDILHEELDGLIEKYTVDEDFDFIMNEELNDISYKQNSKHKHVFVYDDNNASIAHAFDIENISSLSKKNTLGKFYTTTPLSLSGIVDLFVFGRLNYNDIAKVKNIESKYVERILARAMESLKSHLD
ncbi:hypothetical protein [Aestuariivivens sediminicola]|uniref:hypothetical protein n=1 Tax=Aestuariivivens sediminicola TaxID=2913560 RepID=UPI001F5711C2|nr:hypothetical protein [Aestuariivivens sediminicola]